MFGRIGTVPKGTQDTNDRQKIVAFLSAAMLPASTACSSKPLNGTAQTSEREDISMEDQFIDIGIDNARQLGGYTGADGRKVRQNVLIRTAGINDISDETAEKLASEYNVKYVVDFRMGYERDAAPDKEIPGAANEWISVYEPDMTDPVLVDMMNKMAEAGDDSFQKSIEYAKTGRLKDLYTEILFSESGQKGYAKFFDILLDNRDGAVLWHCTYGKDRTGVAAALILYALGVDEDVIMQDFLLTNEVYKNNIAYLEKELISRGCDEMVIGETQAMAGVKGEYLTAALDAVKEKYGSIQVYIKNQLGVSDEETEQLRNMYLE